MARLAILKKFYDSKEWRQLRLLLINQRATKEGKIICEKCKKEILRSIDVIAHHTIELTPENVKDRLISLNPELIELICFNCHNKEHTRFGYKPNKDVFIVYGPPLSGKTTFVRQNMKRGDLIVDMDKLYEAVTMLPPYDKPDNILYNVRAIHRQLIDNIKTRYGKWNNAWIIGGYPDRYKREKMANDLGAELIFCNLSKEECMSRLILDEDRFNRKDEWEQYINKWFNKYTE